MTEQPEAVEDVRQAICRHSAVVIRGGGTKSPQPRIQDQRATLDLRRLSGITEYSPDECVLTTMAGTPLREINERLGTHGQYLPFDPPFAAAGATIGGTVAAGLSGSGRYRYGGIRDFVIGARLIDGEGRLIRSGGKVVKNAAGFLLHHGIVGSGGRFGVLTEISLKVFPAPEARATLRVRCGSVGVAVQLLRTIEGNRFDLEAMDFDSGGTMWLRLAGRAETLRGRVENIRRVIPYDNELFEGDKDERMWNDAREFSWAPPTGSLVKVPVTAATIPRLDQIVSLKRGLGTAIRYACGGAVAWVLCSDELHALSEELVSMRLRGLVVRGRHAGTRVGTAVQNEFEERCRRVLDPQNRFGN